MENKVDYWKIFREVHKEKYEYFKRWYHEKPMIITKKREAEFEK